MHNVVSDCSTYYSGFDTSVPFDDTDLLLTSTSQPHSQ